VVNQGTQVRLTGCDDGTGPELGWSNISTQLRLDIGLEGDGNCDRSQRG